MTNVCTLNNTELLLKQLISVSHISSAVPDFSITSKFLLCSPGE